MGVWASFNRLTTVLLRRFCSRSSSSGPPSPSALRSNEPSCKTNCASPALKSKAMVLFPNSGLPQDALQVLAGLDQQLSQGPARIDLGRRAHDSNSLRSSGAQAAEAHQQLLSRWLRGTEPRLIATASRPWVRVRSACDRDNGAAGQMVAPVSLEFATCRASFAPWRCWGRRNPVFGPLGVQPPWARQHHDRPWFGPRQRVGLIARFLSGYILDRGAALAIPLRIGAVLCITRPGVAASKRRLRVFDRPAVTGLGHGLLLARR